MLLNLCKTKMKDEITVYIRELPLVENVYQMFNSLFCSICFFYFGLLVQGQFVSENILVIL